VQRLAGDVAAPARLDIDLSGIEHLDGAATAQLEEQRSLSRQLTIENERATRENERVVGHPVGFDHQYAEGMAHLV
jgi:hypothetical protein